MADNDAAAVPILPLPDLNTTVRWLRQHGVETNRLARLLRTTPEYVRLLNYRGKHGLSFNPPPPSLDTVLARPTASFRRGLGIRPEEDSIAYSAVQSKKITDLEDEIEAVWTSHVRSGRFLDGLTLLQRYEAKRGYPASARWFRLMARLRQHCAWFRVHSGMSLSAFQDAKAAIDLSHLAYRESEDPLDLRRLTEACLIASNACLLSSDPNSSLKLLDLASAASARIFDPLGSEHYRQRGTALLQMFQDEKAAEAFANARPAMEMKQEASKPAHLAMVDGRQRALLGKPNVDMAVSVLAQVRRDFPWTGLEHAMCLSWTAACALLTDSPDQHSLALDYLRDSVTVSEPFGHQATRSHLLALTPELGLHRQFWPEWIRRALYANAYKGR